MPPSHARHLVAEVLDKQIVDAKKNKLGKVDGLVIVLQTGTGYVLYYDGNTWEQRNR